jgi:hypothetical protein
MTRRIVGISAGFCALAVAGFVGVASVNGGAEEESAEWIYELRTYTTAEGKLPALHARFRDHTMKLFEKHGMKNVAYWTPMDKENTLVYIVAHRSETAAKKSWAGFISDPDWQKAYKASRSDGPLVTGIDKHFLTPTDYSPMK